MSYHYRQDGAGTVTACVLEDITLLYHRRSGQTHMVISPVPEILQALDDGAALTPGDILDRLERRYDLGPRAQALEAIEAHLVELTALGLVRSA